MIDLMQIFENIIAKHAYVVIDLKHLESALAIVEEGNLSRAAARLHLSQSALTRRIQELEKDLGFALFEPAGRSVQLTGEGEAFLSKGRDLILHADAVDTYARSFARGESGILRVGASPHVLERLFPTILSRYRQVFGGVEVMLYEDSSDSLLSMLKRREIQLAFGARPMDDRVESRIVASANVLAAVARTHPINMLEKIELQRLEDERILSLNEGFVTRRTFDAACRLAHIEPRNILESSAPHTILSLAEAGLGVAIVPSTVKFDRYDLHVAPVVRNGLNLDIHFAASWNRGQFLARYVDDFIEEAARVATDELALNRN